MKKKRSSMRRKITHTAHHVRTSWNKLDKRYVFTGVFAITGLLVLVAIKAAPPVAKFEAESGSGSGTSVGLDGTASNGQFLQFGSGQSPPTEGGGIDFPTNPTYQQSSVSQYGITWTFDKAYTVGKYANGDWWVKGPVVVTSITPAANRSSMYHGENINPGKGGWNYDKDINGTTSSNFQAFTYPRTVQPGSSIVKTVSRPPTRDLSKHPRTALQDAAILTVVADNPPQNGATAFRPPFFGSAKPQYLTTNLRMNLWPSLPIPSGMASTPTLAEANSRFSRAQMDFGIGNTFNERIHAANNGQLSYGGYIAQAVNNTVLRLMLSEPIDQKSQGIISIVQYGIDLAPMVQAGSYICADIQLNCAGHGGGRHLPISIAATLLNAQPIRDVINSKQDAFIQNYTVNWRNAPTPLWGDKICTVEEYNRMFHDSDASGSRSCRDPYGYIDGGYFPGASYQGINNANFEGDAVALHLMPSLKESWPQADEFLKYMDRVKDFGAWTKPDPYNRDPAKHGDRSTIISDGFDSPLAKTLWNTHNLSGRITTNWAGL